MHSEDAIYATLAALLASANPAAAKVRSIIYVEPAGFLGKDNIVALVTRFARQAAENVLRDPQMYMNNWRSSSGMLRPLTSLHEATAIASTHVPALLTKLYQEHGVKVGIIAGELDGVSPSRQIEQTISHLSIPYEYTSLPIRHDGMYTQSELIAGEVQRMLEKLNSSHGK